MHLHFERVEKPSSYCDCNIRTLSWMGKVPDGPLQKEEEGWKLNRSQYYSDGWLATGNVRGIVGCTFTTCACRRIPVSDLPARTNYNLRGHRAEVTIVKWNEPYQKLATCDSSGIIFVWIKYEGRWSIELINDRNTPVTDFSWSHDGRMALICYTDGFVLVGSVTGQRYWSSMLNLDSCHTTCGIWSPDDQHVFFGTSKGHVVVIQVNGTVVSQVTIRDGVSILSMAWSCEKFKMEDTDEAAANEGKKNQDYVLAVCFTDGVIYLMKNFDDIFPTVIASRLESVKMEWSNNGDVLAVAGHKRMVQGSRDSGNAATPPSSSSSNGSSFSSALNDLHAMLDRNPRKLSDSSSYDRSSGRKTQATTCNNNSSPLFLNSINFYTVCGILRFRVNINFLLHPITALTWGHNDKRIFVATGAVLHIAWVSKKVPSLQLLSRLAVFRLLPSESATDHLSLPSRIQTLISSLFGRTLRCYLPQLNHLRDFVSKPPIGSVRLHCTLIRHDDDLVGGSTTYVLYLEYLGGLVPILKGKRASKLRPEFVIFDPQPEEGASVLNPNKAKDSHSAPQSRSMTPVLSRRQKSPAHAATSQLYWTSRSAPASGTESEGEQESNCMTDSYGHVYSLPSPMMRRKCRRKRRGAAQPDPEQERTAHPNGPIQEQQALLAEEAADPVPNSNNGANNGGNNGGNNHAEGNNRPQPEAASEPLKPESTYMDEMPEADRLILVTSNIWGTKFKILGLSSRLPSCLGTISYRTSVLHLQPRQMTLHIKELGSRRSSTRNDLKLSSPELETNPFIREEDKSVTPGSMVDFSDSYAAIAPMTPRMSVRGQRSGISPDRRRSLHHLRSAGRRSQSDHRPPVIPLLNEDVLTLQISSDSNRVTMELHQLPASSGTSFQSSAQSRYSSHHRSHSFLLPLTRQPSSLHDLPADVYGPYFAHLNQGHVSRDKGMFSPSDDSHPDDMIAQMARQLAAEYTLTQLTTSPAAKHPSLQPTASALSPNDACRSLLPPSNHPIPPPPPTTIDFCSSLPVAAVSSSDLSLRQPLHPFNHQQLSMQKQQEQRFPDPRWSPHSFRAPDSASATSVQTILYPVKSLSTSEEATRRPALSSIGSQTSAFHDAGPAVTSNCGEAVPVAVRPSLSSADRSGNQDRVRGYRRQQRASASSWQHMQHINQKQADLTAGCPSSATSSPLSMTPYIPISRLNQQPSLMSATDEFSSAGANSQSSDEFGFRGTRDRTSLKAYPRDAVQFADEIHDGLIRGEKADVCSSHHPHHHRGPAFPVSSSSLLPAHCSPLSFPSPSSPGPECESLILSPRASTSEDSAINPLLTGRDHSDFLNVRIRSSGSSTPSSEVPRLTLRPLFRKSMSGVPLGQTFEMLHQPTRHLDKELDNQTSTAKFNCTELDGIGDAADSRTDESLSCECENDCSDSPSHTFRPKSKAGLSDYVSERPAHPSDAGYNSNCNVIGSSSVFSTPVHRANRNRSLDFRYESIMGHDSLISLPAVPISTMVHHADQPMSPGLIEILPVVESDRIDRRQRQKMHLQLHHPPADLRPSPGFAADCERIPNMSAINFALLRSNSINSSSPSDARIRSLPASPANRRRALGRSILNSPLVLRKVLKQKLNYLDCSSEDEESSETEDGSRDFLESFQRSKIKHTLVNKGKGKPRRGSRVQPEDEGTKFQEEVFREFILQNKAPFWNELSQVYQLDFGGRVTQESAKNFQIEHQANQVMQFGRIDGNAYTLDFQYPFSALQALAVALANVTQRLK